jgi:hypothetical protein
MTHTTLDSDYAIRDQLTTPGVANSERLVERFLTQAQVRESHDVVVHAPAELVLDVAERFNLMSIPAVFTIFWLRSRILGSLPPDRNDMDGLVASTRRMGWVELARRPGREVVMGAAVQPWLPAPIFKPVPPDRFFDYAEPNHVKIAWTLEVEPVGQNLTRLRTETRVQPTDDSARRKFRWYWMRAGIGIVLIRWLALPAIRREAERQAKRSASRDDARGVGPASLIDRFLPAFEASIVRETVVDAPAEVTYTAIGETNLLDGVVRALFAARELPERFLAKLRRRPAVAARRTITMSDFLRPGTGMVRLAEEPGAEIVVGSVGRFWQADYGHRSVSPEEFTEFSEPGYVNSPWTFPWLPSARHAVHFGTRRGRTRPTPPRDAGSAGTGG